MVTVSAPISRVRLSFKLAPVDGDAKTGRAKAGDGSPSESVAGPPMGGVPAASPVAARSDRFPVVVDDTRAAAEFTRESARDCVTIGGVARAES